MKTKNLYLIILILAIGFSFLFGLMLGTYATISNLVQAGEGILEGTTFNVDLNETELVNRINETIFPQMIEELKKENYA